MSEGDLDQNVLNWIKGEGYPLEMETSRTCRTAGFEVTQNAFYTDPESGDLREIDLLARHHEFSEPWGWEYDVMLAIECKSSVKGKPWIVFTTEHSEPFFGGSLVVYRLASPRGFEALRAVSLDPEIQALPLFRLPERPGLSLTQAFKSEGDAAYGALLGVTKAAHHFAEDVPEDGAGNPRRARVVFPVLVVDTPLFECFDSEGAEDLTLHRIAHTTICWGRPASSPRLRWPFSFIDVVHIDHLDQFARERRNAIQALIDAFHGAFTTSKSER